MDIGEPGLLRRRNGWWLRIRVLGLLGSRSRLARSLRPDDPQSEVNGDGADGW